MVSGTIFFKCDFSGATFRACDIDQSEFISCNLTCSDMQASAVSDTSFTDCIIGGMKGPENFTSCSFVYPRYARRTPITSPFPYVVMTSADKPLVMYRTQDAWHIHHGDKRLTVGFDGADAPELYANAVLYGEKIMREHEQSITAKIGERV
jgi:hypothetical protein